MSIRINSEKFEIAHELFKEHLLAKSGGVPFTNFQHPFFLDDEISYKMKIYHTAKKAIRFDMWHKWKNKPENIVFATKEACKSTVSGNLLEHRYGPNGYSEAPLYRAKTIDQTKALGSQLYDFLENGPSTPLELGIRFDNFADYLKKNHLGCKWPFLSYLIFLKRPQSYFPIRPSHFDRLLNFYEINESISGQVSWERYSILLELADSLKQRLTQFGVPNTLDVQSYMWIISYLIENKKLPIKKAGAAKSQDFASELERRRNNAAEKERIGLLGEEYVFEQEIDKLRKAGRKDLAIKVKTTFSINDDLGYDILSFDSDGNEMHIEVKTTTRSLGNDDGFWLSDRERNLGKKDTRWIIYRVWDIYLSPSYKNLGNIFLGNNSDWDIYASSWYVKKRDFEGA